MAKVFLRFDHSYSTENKLILYLSNNGSMDSEKLIVKPLRALKYDIFLSDTKKEGIPQSIFVGKDITSFGKLEHKILESIKKDVNLILDNIGLAYRYEDFYL